MADTYAGLGNSQVKQSSDSNLAAARVIEASCCLFDRIWEPRPVTLMEKQLRWAHILSGVELLRSPRWVTQCWPC